ncbi:hypothetical protein B0T26DRAFT_734952 [Lasiosphaeria miniovina]|uniref:Uncharacterized protein n=1 Tax=Lasiosphaeria miniovina TaxID=1954250 RepID=A0AA39ZQQ5_9PEZI|nr:uncharacterized protein B0T26DRAFT_734952 [Lasiosphaeria miniovina]KAK0701858.1 hypothetical protein B0T26DRAFT_734952 [Lasiosphaeria miniovina]
MHRAYLSDVEKAVAKKTRWVHRTVNSGWRANQSTDNKATDLGREGGRVGRSCSSV